MNEFVAEHSHEPTADSDLVKHLKSIIKVLILLFLLNLKNEALLVYCASICLTTCYET